MAKPSLMAGRVMWIENLVQISPFVKKSLAKPIPDAVCISKRWLFPDYCRIFLGEIAVYNPETWAFEKVDFSWVKSSVLFSLVQISPFVVCNAVFSARQHIWRLSSPVRPSVRPSVCSTHGWISQRRLKLGSCNLHHRVAHDSSLTLNFTAKFQREHRERGRRIRERYEKYAIFSQ